MAMYNPQHIDVRNLVLSPNKQAAYGTALVDAKLTHRMRFDPNSAQASVSKQFFNDTNKAGKGHVWATEHLATQQDTGLKFTTELYDFIAGWLGAWGMGKEVVTGAGPYTHVFTFDQTTNLVSVTTAYIEDGGGIKYKMPDLAITEFEISGSDTGIIQVTVTMSGSGKMVDGAIGAMPALPNNVYLLSNVADILLGAQGAPVSIKERVRQWTVKVMRNVEIHRNPGKLDNYATATKRGLERVSASLVIAVPDADDMRALFLNDTIQELQINIQKDANSQLNMKFPGIYFSGYQIGHSGNEAVYQMDSDENAVIKSGNNEVFQMTVINSIAAYVIP